MRFRLPGVLALTVVAILGLSSCGDDDEGTTATTQAPAAPDEATTTSAAEDTTTTAAPEEEQAAPADATVALADTSLGSVLVDAEGMTLYLFTNDTDGVSTCSGGCAETWPALVADSPTGGDGVDASLLGTAPLPDGSNQVTYNGHPLYYFAPDEAPGDTNGQGVGGVWWVVDASGEAIET